MRKALIVLLVALLISAVGFAAAHGTVNQYKEYVTWEETTLYGDKSEVEGVSVRTMNHYSQRLLWETEGTLGGELNPKTEFTFSNNSFSFPSEITYEGLHMNASEDFLAGLGFGNEDMPEYAKVKYADLIAYCRECYDTVAMGEEKNFTVNLAEYMDYYSLEGLFDLPGQIGLMWSEFDTTWVHEIISDDMVQQINDFFRIPILGDYIVEFSINKHETGNSYGTSYGGGIVEDIYKPAFGGVYVNDTCYITFNAVADSGEVADTSLIPGGYGIYQMNVETNEEGNLIPGEPFISMVYALDPAEEFYYLYTSDDGKHLYLHTWIGDSLMRTIIDIETMTCLQKIELTKQPENFYRKMKQYDDFLVILQLSHNNENTAANTITVFQEDEQGLYHHCFTVPMNSPELNVCEDLLIFDSTTTEMDFNGETLVVVQNEFMSSRYAYSYGDNCNFYALTYNADGLSYAGKYSVNLSEINVEINEQTDTYEWACKPYYEDPISVKWN